MGMCKSCGGEVGHDGFAMKMAEGGEVEEIDPGEAMDFDGDEVAHPDERMGMNREDGFELEERQPVESGETEQQAGTELLRAGAFADAIRGRRPAAMAHGGKVAAVETSAPPLAPDLMEMKRKKYGFGKGR